MDKVIGKLNGFDVLRFRLSDLVPSPWNPRRMPPDQAAALKRSMQEFGTVEPIVVNRTTGHVVGGHMRLDALREMGEVETDVLVVELPEEKEKALNIALNRISGEWEEDKLGDLLRELQESGDAGLTGFSEGELADLLAGIGEGNAVAIAHSTLAERFLVPPFSVLDARQGYWQERKAAWIALGIQSELGRGGGC